MTYLDRLPKGSRRPEPAVVIRDALAAARAAGHLDEVRAALVAVYGAALVDGTRSTPEFTPAEIELANAEYREWAGESERDAAVRDTNAVVELQSRKGEA